MLETANLISFPLEGSHILQPFKRSRSTSNYLQGARLLQLMALPFFTLTRFADRKEEVFTPYIFSFVLTAAHRVSTSDILRFSQGCRACSKWRRISTNAPDGNRTHDTLIKSQVPYRLATGANVYEFYLQSNVFASFLISFLFDKYIITKFLKYFK